MRQRLGAAGEAFGGELIAGDAAVAVEAAAHVHQLGGALGLPALLLLARQLHPDRAADRLRQAAPRRARRRRRN